MNIIEFLKEVALPLTTGIAGWFGSRILTAREAKKTDLQIINEAITPLLNSITELTKTVEVTQTKLINEQEKSLSLIMENKALIAEKGDLMKKVEELEKKVAKLTKLVQNLTKANETKDTNIVDL